VKRRDFYEQKIEMLRDARHMVDTALAHIDQAIDHEENDGDPDSIEMELRPLEDGLTDMANQIDDLIEAVEPLYDMERKANETDPQLETRIK
jgi:DNA-binding transcriptional MerR regulator